MPEYVSRYLHGAEQGFGVRRADDDDGETPRYDGGDDSRNSGAVYGGSYGMGTGAGYVGNGGVEAQRSGGSCSTRTSSSTRPRIAVGRRVPDTVLLLLCVCVCVCVLVL